MLSYTSSIPGLTETLIDSSPISSILRDPSLPTLPSASFDAFFPSSYSPSSYLARTLLAFLNFIVFSASHLLFPQFQQTTNQPLSLDLPPRAKSPVIPYKFHSENKIGDVGLRVYVDVLDAVRFLSSFPNRLYSQTDWVVLEDA